MNPSGSTSSSVSGRHRALLAADGYAELGLPDLAWEEIDQLPESDKHLPEVREIMLGLYIRQGRWAEAISEGGQWCREGIDRPAIYIHTAYALHETGRTPEARAILQSGPASLRSNPLYHYNMACYLATAGSLKDAEVCLRTAFRMDEKLRQFAKKDPDLKDFRSIL